MSLDELHHLPRVIADRFQLCRTLLFSYLHLCAGSALVPVFTSLASGWCNRPSICFVSAVQHTQTLTDS